MTDIDFDNDPRYQAFIETTGAAPNAFARHYFAALVAAGLIVDRLPDPPVPEEPPVGTIMRTASGRPARREHDAWQVAYCNGREPRMSWKDLNENFGPLTLLVPADDLAERDAAIERVRALHVAGLEHLCDDENDDWVECAECAWAHPCPTIRALDGEP